MKTKFLVLFALMALVFSCTTEEVNEQIDETQITVNQERSGEEAACDEIGCVFNYNYPTQIGGPILYVVTYDSNLTLAEVECVRQEYFNCYSHLLRMHIIQPQDPYMDHWTTIDGKPDGDLGGDLCSDPRVTTDCGQ